MSIVDRGPNPFDEIPVAWNVNLPRPDTPYGIGDPENVHDLQDALNRVASHLHNHLRYFASPQEYVPAKCEGGEQEQRAVLQPVPVNHGPR